MLVDACDECRFDGSRWTDQDVLTTLGALRAIWDGYLDGAGDDVLQRRPDPATWSIAEYTRHVPDTLWAMRFLADLAKDRMAQSVSGTWRVYSAIDQVAGSGRRWSTSSPAPSR